MCDGSCVTFVLPEVIFVVILMIGKDGQCQYCQHENSGSFAASGLYALTSNLSLMQPWRILAIMSLIKMKQYADC